MFFSYGSLSSSQMNLSMNNNTSFGSASRPAPMPPSSNFQRKASMQPNNSPIRPFFPGNMSNEYSASNGSPTVSALAAEFSNRLDSGRSKSISMPRGNFGITNGSDQSNGLSNVAPALAP